MFRTVPAVKVLEQPDMAFGIVPKALLNEFCSTSIKKEKCIALKEIEEILCNASDISIILPHQIELVHFLNEVLMDSSQGFLLSKIAAISTKKI